MGVSVIWSGITMSNVVGEINPPKAWEMMQGDCAAVLIDVRTAMEYHYVGHPVGAIHLPWVEPPTWQPDPQFVQRVDERLRAMDDKSPPDIHDLPLLLICRSGSRSGMAAEQLAASGFNNVYNVLEGFEGERDGRQHRSTINGWRFHNLPWLQD